MNEIMLKPIGHVLSQYTSQSGTPIQPNQGNPVEAEVIIYSEFREGLNDLIGFDRVWLISFLHKSKGYNLKIVPFRDTVMRGLFSTRAPRRPNPIGISLVRLESVVKANGILKIIGIDLLESTPILDIKPYVPEFESFPDSQSGWLENGTDRDIADSRFSEIANDC